MKEEFSKSIKKLLLLLQLEERENLAANVGLSKDSNIEQIENAIRDYPRYEIMRLFLLSLNPTLAMFEDIFSVLEMLNVSVRTTGCIFMLNNPLVPDGKTGMSFSKQTVGLLSDMSSVKNWSNLNNSLLDLWTRWSSFTSIWRNLLSRAEPRRYRGDVDIVQSYIRSEMIYEPDRRIVNKNELEVLEYFVEKVKQLVKKLEDIQLEYRVKTVRDIIDDMNTLIANADKVINRNYLSSYRRQQRADKPIPSENIIHQTTTINFLNDFNRFLEDALLLGQLIVNEEKIYDLLRLDIWSNRAQLYEVWILFIVIRWLLTRGYKIKLLQTENRDDITPFRWILSYSMSKHPCAVIQLENNNSYFIYYQLYRKSGDMPDISLLAGQNPNSEAIWSIDLKHSELKGYSLADYRKTAIRYHESFGAQLSLIIEYFDRSDICISNPLRFDEGAFLIHDCSPGSEAIDLFLGMLTPFHPVISKILICIDLSSSFENQLPFVLNALRHEFLTDIGQYLDEFICFAGNAEDCEGFRRWISSGETNLFSKNLIPGTNSEPLLAAILKMTEKYNVGRVLLVTDGAFDIPCNEIVDKLRSKDIFEVNVYPEINLPLSKGIQENLNE